MSAPQYYSEPSVHDTTFSQERTAHFNQFEIATSVPDALPWHLLTTQSPQIIPSPCFTSPTDIGQAPYPPTSPMSAGRAPGISRTFPIRPASIQKRDMYRTDVPSTKPGSPDLGPEVMEILNSAGATHAIHRHVIQNGFRSLNATDADEVFQLCYNIYHTRSGTGYMPKRKFYSFILCKVSFDNRGASALIDPQRLVPYLNRAAQHCR